MIHILLLVLFGMNPQAQSPAQSNPKSMLRPVTVAARNAGTLHFGTGTWTRTSFTSDLLSTDIIYNNSCPTYPNTAQGIAPGQGRLALSQYPDRG